MLMHLGFLEVEVVEVERQLVLLCPRLVAVVAVVLLASLQLISISCSENVFLVWFCERGGVFVGVLSLLVGSCVLLCLKVSAASRGLLRAWVLADELRRSLTEEWRC